MSDTRIVFLYCCISILFLIITFRIFFLSITFESKDYRNKFVPSHEDRGRIVDSNGVILAGNIATKSLYIDTTLISNREDLSDKLATILKNQKSEDILKKISKKRRWILLEKHITPLQYKKILYLKMASIVFKDNILRIYPHKKLASNIIGYINIDSQGVDGIEKQYDGKLKKGEDIKLALDIRIQDIIYNILSKKRIEYSAKFAISILMNINNGEIISLLNIPNFDSNNANKEKNSSKYNLSTYALYEFGSVFKIFSNALLLENDLVTLRDKFYVKDPIKYGRFSITDYSYKKDIMNVEEIFLHSSNIGTVKMIKKISASEFKNFLDRLNLLDRLEPDFPAVAHPIFPEKWRDINLYTASYGYGISVTPLHFITAASAIVNGGNFYQPSFKKIDKNPNSRSIISRKTSKLINYLLRVTVESGTAKNLAVKNYKIGSKTGTANKIENKRYVKDKVVSSAVTVFPIDNPKYILFVIFDEPNIKNNNSSTTAIPASKEIIENIIPFTYK